jgi:hypothetical protein
MMWRKSAERIVAEMESVDIGQTDLDNIAYYMTHMSSPKMWQRFIDFGDSLVYHSRQAQGTHKADSEGEQLWLQFSK